MRLTAPENFDGDATTDRLDPTWKVQVDLLDPTRRSSLESVLVNVQHYGYERSM